jgi:hypothetical protein
MSLTLAIPGFFLIIASVIFTFFQLFFLSCFFFCFTFWNDADYALSRFSISLCFCDLCLCLRNWMWLSLVWNILVGLDPFTWGIF